MDFIDRHRGIFVALFAVAFVIGMLMLVVHIQDANNTNFNRITAVSTLSCERADLARFQVNSVEGVVYAALSFDLKYDEAYLKKAKPSHNRTVVQSAVNTELQQIAHLTVLPSTNCALLYKEGIAYHTPSPVYIGSKNGKLNPKAKSVINESNRVLSSPTPMVAVEKTFES